MDFNNLGWVKAVHKGSDSPSNTDMLWYDTATNAMKYYNTTSSMWVLLAAEPTPVPPNSVLYAAFQTVDATPDYEISALHDCTILAVKMGQYFVDDTEYSFNNTTDMFTLSTTPDGVYSVLILYTT